MRLGVLYLDLETHLLPLQHQRESRHCLRPAEYPVLVRREPLNGRVRAEDEFDALDGVDDEDFLD